MRCSLQCTSKLDFSIEVHARLACYSEAESWSVAKPSWPVMASFLRPARMKAGLRPWSCCTVYQLRTCLKTCLTVMDPFIFLIAAHHDYQAQLPVLKLALMHDNIMLLLCRGATAMGYVDLSCFYKSHHTYSAMNGCGARSMCAATGANVCAESCFPA